MLKHLLEIKENVSIYIDLECVVILVVGYLKNCKIFDFETNLGKYTELN